MPSALAMTLLMASKSMAFSIQVEDADAVDYSLEPIVDAVNYVRAGGQKGLVAQILISLSSFYKTTRTEGEVVDTIMSVEANLQAILDGLSRETGEHFGLQVKHLRNHLFM